MRVPFVKTAAGALAAAALAASVAAPGAARAGEADDAVLNEINYAREYPQAYALWLAFEPVSAWERALGRNGPAGDPDARAEAIDFLLRQAPLPPLRMDDQLVAAALEHVADQGPVGAVGHNGPAGERFDDRLRRHGVRADLEAENIAYGPAQPSDVVRELIIDSGVPSRGHRTNIFHGNLAYAGVSCGPHKAYGAMCVIDFAGRPAEGATWRQASLTSETAGAQGQVYALFSGF